MDRQPYSYKAVGLCLSLWVICSPSLQASTTLFTTGSQSLARFGSAVAITGDINNDGAPDVLIGAPTDSPVVLGTKRKAAGSATLISGKTGNVLYRLFGDNAGDNFGVSVAATGDVNGDAIPDFIVGANMADHTISNHQLKNTGSATVFSGATGLKLVRWYGEAAGDMFGTAVSSAGDVNADSKADVIIGAPKTDHTVDGKTMVDTGLAIVYTEIGNDTSHEAFRLYGNAAGDNTGSAVSTAGDVDGDSYSDVVIGEPLVAAITTSSGTKPAREVGGVRVLSGVDGLVKYSFLGENAGDHFGASVTGGADLDNDAQHRPDIVVGAPYYDLKTTVDGKTILDRDIGRVYVFSGDTGSNGPFVIFTGSASGNLFGAAVAIAGDRDADNVPDIAIGSPLASAQLTNGTTAKAAGKISVFSCLQGDNSPPLLTLSGAAANDSLGVAVDGTSDTNTDGINDLLIGEKGVDIISKNNGDKLMLRDAGKIEIVSGAESGYPAISLASGDLTTRMSPRQFPKGLIDVATARINRLITDNQTAYAYAWNYFNNQKHYYKLTTSTDGVHWSDAKKVLGINNTYQIAADGNTLMAVGCEDKAGVGIFTIKQSSDGANWDTVETPGTTNSYCLPSSYTIDVVGDHFVILDKKNCKTLASSDGVHWTNYTFDANTQGVTAPLTCGLTSRANDTFIVQHGLVQANTQPEGSAAIYETRFAFSTSENGIDWTTRVVNLDPQMVYASDMVMFPDGQTRMYSQQSTGGPKIIWESPDRITWSISQSNIAQELPYFSLYHNTGNNTPSALLQGNSVYTCSSTDQGAPNHVLRYALQSSNDGIGFTDSTLFSVGGLFESGYTCGVKAYLPQANRLIMFGAKAPTADNFNPGGNFILSTD